MMRPFLAFNVKETRRAPAINGLEATKLPAP